MFSLKLSEIPSVADAFKAPSETKICTQCGHDKDINAFGWRYCYEQRLEICKYCRNANAKLANRIKKFKQFNKLTMMKWNKSK